MIHDAPSRGPAGIPPDVTTKLGLLVVASPPSALAESLQRDVPKWGKAVKDSGAVAD
jgi:hypothetical protein